MSSSPTEQTGSLGESQELTEVVMPQMGVSVAEGTITAWRKQVGDWVERDEPILDISTDKVETEVPSPAAGRVAELIVAEGETVEVGTLLATLDTGAKPGEAHAAEANGDGSQAAEPKVPTAAATESAAPAQPTGSKAPRGTNSGNAAPVSPVVRRIADEHSVDLGAVPGTGRRGRVTKKDLLIFIESGEGTEGAQPPTSAGSSSTPAPSPGSTGASAPRALHIESPYVEEPPLTSADAAKLPGGGEMSVMRKRIAEHMVRSVQTAAHCTTVTEADMAAVERARKGGPKKLSYLAFVARATVGALRENPQLNATIEGDRITPHEEVHLGIAVSLGDAGLVVPVIRNAHELSHEGIAARIADVAERARSKRLEPGETQGGTFTITNPGPFGTLISTPIINQPQVGILDLEAVAKRPVVVTDADGNDSIAIRPMSYLCLSWDHRAIDGVRAAQFLAALRAGLEGWRG